VELLFVVVVVGRRILFASCFDSPTTHLLFLLLVLQICVFWGMSVFSPLSRSESAWMNSGENLAQPSFLLGI
jgi:hypothetical protein